jgi:phosphatidylglycerophosphatase A
MRTIKESSDEPIDKIGVREAFSKSAPAKRTARDFLALALATCGVGLIPFAPGTWGSIVGVCIFYLARFASAKIFDYGAALHASAASLDALRATSFLIGLLALGLAGVWAATRAETLFGRKDPGAVVVDEVVGQLITLLAVPFSAGWRLILAGFLMFRLFDIWKPYPVRNLEALPSGLGIMADDVLAGIYAATAISLIVWLSFQFP